MYVKNRTVWQGKKVIVLVQPVTLLEEGVIPPGKKTSFENFILKAKERGAQLFLVTYSHVIWWELAKLSDFIFVFLTKKGFKKYNKNERGRGLSKEDIHFLLNANVVVACDKKDRPPCDIDEFLDGLKIAYEEAAVFFHSQISKSGVKNIILCGGFDTLCVKFFLLSMAKLTSDIEVIIPTNFLARKSRNSFFLRTMGNKGISINGLICDENYLLNLI